MNRLESQRGTVAWEQWKPSEGIWTTLRISLSRRLCCSLLLFVRSFCGWNHFWQFSEVSRSLFEECSRSLCPAPCWLGSFTITEWVRMAGGGLGRWEDYLELPSLLCAQRRTGWATGLQNLARKRRCRIKAFFVLYFGHKAHLRSSTQCSLQDGGLQDNVSTLQLPKSSTPATLFFSLSSRHDLLFPAYILLLMLFLLPEIHSLPFPAPPPSSKASTNSHVLLTVLANS